MLSILSGLSDNKNPAPERRVYPWRIHKGVHARLRRAMDARERAYGSR